MTRLTRFKQRRLDLERPVEIYRNLHRGGYSIRQDDLVVAHADNVVLLDATFTVRHAGRLRALREGRRNVHAWVAGRLVTTREQAPADERELICVSYSPFSAVGFHQSHHIAREVRNARLVQLDKHGCWAWLPNAW